MEKPLLTPWLGQKNLWVWLISLALFGVVLVPRLIGLDSFIAIDEARWVYRSAFFWRAVLAGDLAQASSQEATPGIETLAPGIPVMWLGGLGLTAKYWLDSDRPSNNLSDYLGLLPEKTEKISLDFYTWTRYSFVLLTSLFVVAFYLLLRQLVKPTAALLAVLFLAFDPFFMGLSRVVHTDMTVCVTLNLALLMLLRYRQRSRKLETLQDFKPIRVWFPRPIGWLVAAGVLGGLALATKPTALYLFIFAGFFLLFERGWPHRGGDWGQALTEGIIFGAVALLTIVAIWPALWTAPMQTLQSALVQSGTGFESEDDPSLLPYLDYPVPQLGFLFYPVNWIFKSTAPLWLGLIGLLAGLKFGWFNRPLAQPAIEFADSATTWSLKWLGIFVVLFYLLLTPADTRDLRYALPTFPALYTLAAVGMLAIIDKLSLRLAGAVRLSSHQLGFLGLGLLLIIQISLAALYFPYYFNYLNPLVGGTWLAPHLIKIGAGEGLDHMAYYLNQKPNAENLRVATSLWDTFVPFYKGRYTKAHYDDEADYIMVYLRQIQNRNPFPEFWPYFAARTPEHIVTLTGLDYVWLYPGPQLREVHEASFDDGLILRGYRLEQPAAQPGQPARLTLVWGGASPDLAGQTVNVQLSDDSERIWAKNSGPVLAADGPSPVEGHYVLNIPATMSRGDYQLRVSREMKSGETVSFLAGLLPVRQLDKPPVQFAAAANFGNIVNFGGANVALLSSVAAESGQQLEVQFLWQARQPIPQPYTTFAHVVDEAGQIWGQADRIPHLAGSELPTTQWDEDEWIVDTFQILLKPETPAGKYKLLAGLYNPQTLERLPVVGQQEGQSLVEVSSIIIPIESVSN